MFLKICIFCNFCREVGQLNCHLSGQQHANIITLFQFSRIVVENCVVGICNNGMFLEFHEFETKYLAGAGVYKRH